jgi:hypothetical protein
MVALVSTWVVAVLLPAPLVRVTETVTGPSAAVARLSCIVSVPVEPIWSMPLTTLGIGVPESVMITLAMAPTWPVIVTL